MSSDQENPPDKSFADHLPSAELLDDVEGDGAPDRDPSARDRLHSLTSRAFESDQDAQRLWQQIDFIIEIDRLKTVLRRTVLTDGSRAENTAEHSWHIAMMALVLSEWANQPVDVVKVVKMLLLHDIVEVDAGDTFCYDETGNLDKAEREAKAAERIFGLLPADQGDEFRGLWEEFELRASSEAKFANALDRLQPMLHNYLTEGHSWRVHSVGRAAVEKRNRPIGDGAEKLWAFAEAFLDDAETSGWFGRSKP